MPQAKRLIHLPIAHLLEVGAVVFAAVGLSLVIATSFVAESIPQTQAVAVPESTHAAAVASISVPTAIPDMDRAHSLYDGGWAGGPGPSYRPDLGWELYRGWHLYDDGWAGGPGPSSSWPTAQP